MNATTVAGHNNVGADYRCQCWGDGVAEGLRQATEQCQEPSSWVKIPTAPSLSCTCRKKGFITSGKPRAEAFVSALLIFLKAFFWFFSPYHGFLFSPSFMA
jgi:hypothetical protein